MSPNSSSYRKAEAFTLVELLVVIAIIGVLISMLLPAVQAAREAARRMQCSNHMKQIALAVHNFHDIQTGLPPSAIYNRKPSFWAMIYPFIEQQALYDILANVAPATGANKAPLVLNATSGGAGSNTNTNNWFSNVLDDDQRKGFGSVSIYKCPSRRSGVRMLYSTSTGVSGSGPRGDYAIPRVDMRPGTGIGSGWALGVGMYGNASDEDIFIRHNVSPFRVGILNLVYTTGVTRDERAKGASSWSVRDSMAYWQDGTTNQLIVGEKFIPTELLDKQPDTNEESHWDGGIIGSFNTGFNANIARNIHATQACIKRSPNDIDPVNYYTVTGGVNNIKYSEAVFGGIHPGICQFALGDGSVRSVPVTVNWDVLYYLAHANDGNPVALP